MSAFEFVTVSRSTYKTSEKNVKFGLYSLSVFSTNWQDSMYVKQIRRVLTKSNASTPPTHSNTVQTHTYRDRCPTWQHPSHQHFQPSVTLCQPRPALFPCLTGLQYPHFERATVTACWITVKYYPDDISIVALSSLFLLHVRMLPWTNRSLVNRASCWQLFAGRPQDTTGVMSHICR